jgi:hypothetical protein
MGRAASVGMGWCDKEGPMRNRIVAVVAAVALCVGLTVPAALADEVYHSSHIALFPTAGTPLRSGFVENIHVNGPNIFAHEIYVFNGAQPETTYQVALNIFAFDPACTGTAAVVPTASITTNVAGNGRADAVLRPSDVPTMLRDATHGVIWTVSDSSGVIVFSSGCEVVTLD